MYLDEGISSLKIRIVQTEIKNNNNKGMTLSERQKKWKRKHGNFINDDESQRSSALGKSIVGPTVTKWTKVEPYTIEKVDPWGHRLGTGVTQDQT